MDFTTDETQEIDNQDLTDNSNVENSEPSADDNSNNSTNEPENTDNQNDKENSNAAFTDLETANNSYRELQKKLGEQGLELGNLRKQSEELTNLKERQSKFLQSLGFNSIDEFEEKQRELQYDEDVSKFEANQYLEYIDNAEFPDEVKKLVMLYHSSNPEEKRQVLDSIEANFSTDIIKKIASNVAMYKGQLDIKRRQALEDKQLNEARSYLQEVTQKYQDEFKNESFVKFYGEAFKALGFDLNSDYFMELVLDLKKSWQAEALKAHNIQVENENAKDRISDSTSSRNFAATKDVLDMTEDELRKELKKYN